MDPGTGRLEYEDVDSFWSRRWLWCVNGAHNRLLERKAPIYAVGDDLPKRIHRCVFVERCTVNPVVTWDGTTYYTASENSTAR